MSELNKNLATPVGWTFEGSLSERFVFVPNKASLIRQPDPKYSSRKISNSSGPGRRNAKLKRERSPNVPIKLPGKK